MATKLRLMIWDMKVMQIKAFFAGACVALSLTACATPEGPAGIHDPAEPVNRAVHGVNKGLDRAVVRPASKAYGAVMPAPARAGLSNAASNLSLPKSAINKLLQGKLDDAAANAARFLFNSTIGIAGLFDPAKTIGLEARDSDFGETLHVWGVGEGAYVELPLLGPSTSRHAVGRAVDFVMDPVGGIASHPEREIVIGTRVGSGLNTRHELESAIDSVLYESADSYAQSRLIYLQNRRFKLGGTQEETQFDPYEDPYDQ